MKNIFITGGNRGIGKGLVEIFSENYKVFFQLETNKKPGQLWNLLVMKI